MAPIRCCFDQTAVWHSDAARGPSTPSFNHLVGAAEQRQWNRDAERLGGLEVDDQLDFGQLLDRQISELGTRKNPAGIDADLTVQVGDIASVADQAAGRRERAKLIDRGYSVAERKCGQLLHLPVEERVGAHDESAGSHPNQGRKAASMSHSVLACSTWTCSPRARAAVCRSFERVSATA